MNDITIFVGPKKTGTSWLHHVVSGSTRAKEMRYPARWGRRWVYRRYVRDHSLLVWPYLLHEHGCLRALLEDLERYGRRPRLMVSVRDDNDWDASLRRFHEKLGASSVEATERARGEREKVARNLAWLDSWHDFETVRIIEPEAADLALLSDACGVSIERLREAVGTRVYESRESSRLSSRLLVDVFFRMKPFLPGNLQEITKRPWLRALFFRDRSVGERRKGYRS